MAEAMVSCYTFHPLIQRFVRLYRCVQVASAWLTCLLSVLCCSCAEAMPMSSKSSSGTTASYEKTSSVAIEAGRSKEHVTIDFTSASGDSESTEKGSKELNTHAELEAVVVLPIEDTEPLKKVMSIVQIHTKPAAETADQQELPALAALIQNQAALEKALNQSEGQSK